MYVHDSLSWKQLPTNNLEMIAISVSPICGSSKHCVSVLYSACQHNYPIFKIFLTCERIARLKRDLKRCSPLIF